MLSGISPATRDAIAYYQIGDNQFKGPLREHFRRRFVSDLRRAKPDMFIDAVVPGTFRWVSWTDNDGFESYSALKSFMASMRFAASRSSDSDSADPPYGSLWYGTTRSAPRTDDKQSSSRGS